MFELSSPKINGYRPIRSFIFLPPFSRESLVAFVLSRLPRSAEIGASIDAGHARVHTGRGRSRSILSSRRRSRRNDARIVKYPWRTWKLANRQQAPPFAATTP
ncbi:hypothetical protein VTI74DRAFT_195 [Chaetomium olivicolor]